MTKTVPLHELRPGDTVQYPSGEVLSIEDGYAAVGYPCEIKGLHAIAWLEKIGATATREVSDDEFDLTWAEALDAMFTDSAVCANDESPMLRYGFRDRRFVIIGSDGSLFPMSVLHSYRSAKWRVVEEKQNG